jgi:hypothetical protein
MDINNQTFSTRASASDGNIVTIFTKKKLNAFKSKEEDERIYDYLPYLEIVSPAQKHSIVIRPVVENDKILYPEHWEAYEKKTQLRNNGTPLSEWTGCPEELIPQMEYLSVFTVEDLCNVSDSNLAKIGMGMLKIRESAKLYVAGTGENELKLKKAITKINKLEKKLEKLVGAKAAILEVPEQENQDEPIIDSPRLS